MASRNLPLGGAIPVEPGEWDRKVTIQQLTEADDSTGAPTNGTWSALTTVYMRKVDVRGRERYEAGQMSAAADTQWEMGYRSDMDPELVNVPKLRRLSYQGRIYDIVRADQIGRREGIELMTIAKVG